VVWVKLRPSSEPSNNNPNYDKEEGCRPKSIWVAAPCYCQSTDWTIRNKILKVKTRKKAVNNILRKELILDSQSQKMVGVAIVHRKQTNANDSKQSKAWQGRMTPTRNDQGRQPTNLGKRIRNDRLENTENRIQKLQERWNTRHWTHDLLKIIVVVS
jgi:hypothetical protein